MRTGFPVDSTEAREIREAQADGTARKAERGVRLAAAARAADEAHAAFCADGWLGETAHGEPIPCTRCRPHLAEQRCSTCTITAATCSRRVGGCCDRCAHDACRIPILTTPTKGTHR